MDRRPVAAAGRRRGQPWCDIQRPRACDPGPTSAEFARQQDCDLIVMGARGLGSNTAALLGSVTQRPIEHTAVPVLVPVPVPVLMVLVVVK